MFPRDLGSSDWVRAAWRPPERPSAWAVPIIGAGAAAQDPANTTEIALASSSGKTSGLQPAPRAASPDKEIVASSPETTRQRASDPDLVALYLEANRASLPHLTAADFATDGIPASSDASTPVRTATAEDAKARPQLLAVSEPIPSDGSKRVERKAEPDPAPVTAAGPPKVAEPEEPAESKELPVQAPSPRVAETGAPEAASGPSNQPNTARRSIAVRAGEGAATEADGDPGAAPETTRDRQSAAGPSVAAAIPERPPQTAMVSLAVPRPPTQIPAPANDEGLSAQSPPPSAAAPEVAAAIPQQRLRTTLGLPGTGDAAGEQTALMQSRSLDTDVSAESPIFSYQDELILEVQVKGSDGSDAIIAYGTQQGIYLPLGTLVRILDLAVRISDGGRYAFGWVLREDRVLGIDLRQNILTWEGEERPIGPAFAVAFEDEMYLRAEDLARFIPVKIRTDLRSQAVLVETLEKFPFQERAERERNRARLAGGVAAPMEEWPRVTTPYLPASIPSADVELRAVSDSTRGERLEGDLLLGGDLAFLTAQGFFSADTRDGLVSSLVELGRRDPDGALLGPLQATEFALGDVSNPAMPLGLRSVAGRGFSVTNAPLELVSAFDRIDLRGVLQDGYEVELYRNDILVGSTADRVNGRYEFLQVPVDFGLNVFRLVFYGPQGQRYEEVRSLSVGDGRLSKGQVVYRVGAVQKDQNLLGVRDPQFIPPTDFGDWRAVAEVGYGISSSLTGVISGASYQNGADDRWTATAGLRSGIGRFALRGDVAAADGGAYAFSGGIGGQLGRSAFTLTHVEYSGPFRDETRTANIGFLDRATELDVNTGIVIGNDVSGLNIPITARLRHFEFASGRKQSSASVRASTRIPGALVSNTFEYVRTSGPGFNAFSQLVGNFDLATFGRSKTRARASLAYSLVPDLDILSASVDVDHRIDDRMAVSGSLGYVFGSRSTSVSASVRRDFDRFSLSLDGNYAFDTKAHAVGLRLGLSFGRDPITGRFFTSRESLAGSGTASIRAFRDLDADGVYGPKDEPMPEIGFAAFNSTASTDTDGVARLRGLGNGRPVSVRIDEGTLPDITLATTQPGVEIVPRAGRIQQIDVPIVEMSEVEGTVTIAQGGKQRSVSGVRLLLKDSEGQTAASAKSEVDGYYFFERVLPGNYSVALDAGQARRLGICFAQDYEITVEEQGSVVVEDLTVAPCD
ncbi:hypothetical protein [Erythrobacter litoralis]|uniref:hypothetical protein n=1 Tax=Erythrobacter litoralis TaxID=39960 RepID=UPI0012DC1119|nr:hypothetical protein [Erythrobacter litoralis]